MLRLFACAALVAIAAAEEAQPSTLESQFFSLFGNVLNTDLYQRRFADITLGLQVAQGFAAMAQAEYQIYNGASGVQSLEQEEVHHVNKIHSAPRPHHRVLEEDASDDEADFVASRPASSSEEREAAELEDSFVQLKLEQDGSSQDPEEMSTHAKTAALKALQLQLFMSASDSEKAYWYYQVVAPVYAATAPAISSIKMYKMYLNTIALATAFQFHDAYTFEAIIDDFNDNNDDLMSAAEAHAELAVYRNWYTLAMIKWQLFMMTIYEQSAGAQLFPTANANNNANNANSFLELEEQFVGAPAAMTNPYLMMAYYVMMLKYQVLMSELSIAQTGFSVASTKVNMHSASTVASSTGADLAKLEGTTLPQLYSQWANANMMKYNMEYYMLMFEIQNPQLPSAQIVQRAENTFLNLFQTQKPETSAPATPSN